MRIMLRMYVRLICCGALRWLAAAPGGAWRQPGGWHGEANDSRRVLAAGATFRLTGCIVG